VDSKLDLSEITGLFPNAKLEGSSKYNQLRGISSLDLAKEGDLSFLGNLRYRQKAIDTEASVILVPEDYHEFPSEGQLFIKLKDPSLGLSIVCKHIEAKLLESQPSGIHPTAFVESSAKVDGASSVGAFSYVGKNVTVGSNTHIQSHCHIGDNVKIGQNCKIHPGVRVLTRCQVGNGVILNAGVVLGSEGYGFDQVGSSNIKTPHLGIVVVEDDVEIGANTCIDRARFDQSEVGAGTKIDNLVQVGHNVKIGKNCLIVAQVGISGSVTMDDQVVVGGQAGFAGHLKIGKGAKIAGQAGITKDVEPGAFLKGNPALPFQLAQRIAILQRKLPDLFNRFAQIEGKK
jgi:UDP-3-O-[3-hydroxymyristoyl] glucosamine N-acyltransferase